MKATVVYSRVAKVRCRSSYLGFVSDALWSERIEGFLKLTTSFSWTVAGHRISGIVLFNALWQSPPSLSLEPLWSGKSRC